MIVITLYNKAITAIGHANYAESGKDIYCAAISSIILGAMNWFKPKDVQYEMGEGLFKVKLVNDTKDNLYKLELLKIQLASFDEKQYKQYISIKKNRKDYYE